MDLYNWPFVVSIIHGVGSLILTHPHAKSCRVSKTKRIWNDCQWQIMSTTTLDYRMANMLGSILELWAKHRLIQSEITMYSIQGFDGIIKQLMIKCICLMEQSECCLLNSWWFDDILSLVWMEQSTCKQVDLMEQSTCWWLISPFFSR